MSAAPDHGCVAALHPVQVQVGVGPRAGEEADAAVALLRAALGAQATRRARELVVIVLWPARHMCSLLAQNDDTATRCISARRLPRPVRGGQQRPTAARRPVELA